MTGGIGEKLVSRCAGLRRRRGRHRHEAADGVDGDLNLVADPQEQHARVLHAPLLVRDLEAQVGGDLVAIDRILIYFPGALTSFRCFQGNHTVQCAPKHPRT